MDIMMGSESSAVCCMCVRKLFSLHILLHFILILSCVNPEMLEICNPDPLQLQCSDEEVIVMETAQYGRMESGTCLEEQELIGCTNDVLFLANRWCSGRSSCDVAIPNAELDAASTHCKRYLRKYMRVSYSCLQVIAPKTQHCSGTEAVLSQSEGILSSHVTDETSCGSARAPWSIEALPGQTISLSLLDFGGNDTTPGSNVYGYIEENHSRTPFDGHGENQADFFVSKSNKIKIQIIPTSERQRKSAFLVQFKKQGCPDLQPPAHAWYKRDGGQAVIGCEWSQKTWHLSCDGHSWSGVLGNCSEPATVPPTKQDPIVELPSALLLTCVVSVAVVLAAVVLVCGVVCIKKFRIKHEIEKATTLPRQYGHYDMDPNIEMASMMYLPYKPCEHEGILVDVNPPTSDLQTRTVSPIHIWEQPLPEVPAKPIMSASMMAAERKSRTPGDGDEGSRESHVDDTMRSGLSELSSLSGGHKYSALNTAN